MAKEYKITIGEWEEHRLIDGSTSVSFEYRCPRCDYSNDEVLRKDDFQNGTIWVGCQRCDCSIHISLGVTEIECTDFDDTTSRTELLIDAACALWDFMGDNFNEKDVARVIKESEFNQCRLDIQKMNSSSEKELFSLCADMVYMLLNGFISGNFETMHAILVDELEIDEKIANELLDF